MSTHPPGSFNFPSPVGGAPFPSDFAPSLVFTLLYICLVPVAIYRLAHKRTRTFVLLATTFFSVERIAVWSLRVAQSRSDSQRTSSGLVKYMQVTLSIGYISLTADLIQLLRIVLVNATRPPKAVEVQQPLSVPPSLIPVGTSVTLVPVEKDRSKERLCYRVICFSLTPLHLVPMLIGIVSGFTYLKALRSPIAASRVQSLRYAGTAIIFNIILVIQCIALYGLFAVRNIRSKATIVIFSLCCLLDIISIYRLVVMQFETTSLTSMAPGSLNSKRSKVLFYIFQGAPEWIVAATLLSINIRGVFGTGMRPDWRFKDKKTSSNDPEPATVNESDIEMDAK